MLEPSYVEMLAMSSSVRIIRLAEKMSRIELRGKAATLYSEES